MFRFKQEDSKTVPLLHGTLLYKDAKAVPEKVDQAILRQVQHGWELKNQRDLADKGLKQINADLLAVQGTGCVITLEGVCSVALSERELVEISNPEALQQVLGSRFQDLVDSRTVHIATDKLKALLADADDPLSEQVRACCTVKISESVTYRPK